LIWLDSYDPTVDLLIRLHARSRPAGAEVLRSRYIAPSSFGTTAHLA